MSIGEAAGGGNLVEVVDAQERRRLMMERLFFTDVLMSLSYVPSPPGQSEDFATLQKRHAHIPGLLSAILAGSDKVQLTAASQEAYDADREYAIEYTGYVEDRSPSHPEDLEWRIPRQRDGNLAEAQAYSFSSPGGRPVEVTYTEQVV